VVTHSPEVAQGGGSSYDRNWHVYVKQVGASGALQVARGEDNESSPCWSPDGSQIAFLRSAAIFLVSALGGAERKLLDFSGAGDGQLSWSPDGKWLCVARDATASAGAGALFLIPLEVGTPRQITRPRAPAYDYCPAFSRVGHSLAYSSCHGVASAATDSRLPTPEPP